MPLGADRIVMKLKGGLGNQMFQFAFGYYLARENHVPLFLEISSYQYDPLRFYELDCFAHDGLLSSGDVPADVIESSFTFIPELMGLRGTNI